MAKRASTDRSLDHRVLMIEELFRVSVPVNNTTLKGGKQVGNLGDECLQYIVLRTWQRWKPSQIADVLGISSHSVRSVLYRFSRDASNFWDSKIVVPIASPDRRRPTRFLCRFNGEQFTSKGRAESHCYETMFSPEAI